MPKQTHPRKSVACKPCQLLKVKCVPSSQGEVCQKCIRSGAECIFNEQKPRRKCEKSNSRTRLAALESKLEDLIAQVGNQNTGSNVGNPRESAKQSETRTFEDVASTVSIADQLPTPGYHTYEPAYTAACSHEQLCTSKSAFPRLSGNEATPETLLSEGLLSADDVDSYIAHFRKMSLSFPFVIIPQDMSLYNMLRHRPLLLHAALAVVTSFNVHLQKALEKSFKELMIRKLVLEGEKSIDLLQSILIYATWGHFFIIPKRDQSYQLLQMAFGLCVDLGLNVTPDVALLKKVGLHLDHYQPTGDADQGQFWSREARRAFLGCYHISAMNSWICAKPRTLEYSEYILQCAKSISESPEYTTDELVLPLIQLQAIGDEYHEVLRVGQGEVHSQIHLDRIGTHVRSFQKRIADLRSILTPAAASSTAIQLALHFTSAYTKEQDLISPFISNRRLLTASPPDNPKDNTIDSQNRINVLIDCLSEAVNCLDIFLAIPASSYPLLSTSQWSSLTFSIAIVYRLSIGTPRIPSWDVQIARETVKLEKYLETMCERVQNETRDRLKAIINAGQSRDMYSLTGLILQNVRNTYERLRHLPQAQSVADEEVVHATSPDTLIDTQELPVPCHGPIFSSQEQSPRPGYQNRCPALQFWNKPESEDSGAVSSMPEDPFWSLNTIDDDGFWNQAFADIAGVGEQWGSGIDPQVQN